MSSFGFLACITFLGATFFVAYATDPTHLQDFCVATDDIHNALFVNGRICKNSTDVKAEDFYTSGLDKAADTSHGLGSVVTLIDASKLAGLNTLGISIARRDFAPYGLGAPHYHPRATEIFTVIEGTIYVGFITSANKLFTKVLNKGDVFVFPQGLIHFQVNLGDTSAFAIAALSSQNPGLVTVANAVFGSKELISVDVLSKAFQVDVNVVKYFQSKFGMSP
ncbi:putative germin-like protein 2-1 [Amaranthus tricolor]|uniref:putative germin-like protein 2-1 n=1 Tax=Amaranthus tricolor TaxID=29722 RepID=UPI0025847B44|nr:putative germin-like protein 2-1 [Amaranthus tricolor]